jgi:hypothetical protein
LNLWVGDSEKHGECDSGDGHGGGEMERPLFLDVGRKGDDNDEDSSNDVDGDSHVLDHRAPVAQLTHEAARLYIHESGSQLHDACERDGRKGRDCGANVGIKY